MEKGKCRSCGAPLLWVRTVAGNLMPLDEEPSPKGNVALVDGVSHFTTCPDAEKFRKGGKK